MPARRRPRPKEASLSFELASNDLAQQVFGFHHGHLARIEQALGLTIHARGNQITIVGPAEIAELGRSVLTGLAKRAGRGLTIGPEEVDALLRMARSPEADVADADVAIHTRKRLISPRSPTQVAYLRAIDRCDMVFGVGPAGTGKTYLAVAKAVEMLTTGQVDRIILTRPAVEAGEQLGFLPGDMREKVDPYLRPLYDALHDMLPAGQVEKRLESDEIEVAPLAFMRGRTLANAFVILDEAQNTTAVQMKMFLTRLGENARMVVTGDLSQVDLPRGIRSGLRDALDVLIDVDGVAFTHFTDADVIRHPLVARIVRAYDAVERRRKSSARYENEPEAGHD